MILHDFACICHICCWLQWWMLLHKFPSDVLKFPSFGKCTEVPNPLAAKLCVVNSQRGARREMTSAIVTISCSYHMFRPDTLGMVLLCYVCSPFWISAIPSPWMSSNSLSFDLSAHRTAASGRVMASAAKCCSASCETCENTRGPKSRVWDTRRVTLGVSLGNLFWLTISMIPTDTNDTVPLPLPLPLFHLTLTLTLTLRSPQNYQLWQQRIRLGVSIGPCFCQHSCFCKTVRFRGKIHGVK